MAGVLLVFCWRGASLDVQWPQLALPKAEQATPTSDQLKWAEPLKPILRTMLPQDRMYLSNFYDAMEYILTQDAGRSLPILGDSDKFIAFHAGSLTAAIDKAKVGKYPGLDNAIDQVFFAACGADATTIGPKEREHLMDACRVLRHAFRVNGG